MKMSRLLFVTLLCIASFVITECRMGWKSNGNEYLVYSANTSFSSTNSLNITGKFSLKKEASSISSTLFALSDANGIFSVRVYIRNFGSGRGDLSTEVRNSQGHYAQTNFVLTPSMSSYGWNFTITVRQSQHNGIYSHTLRTELDNNAGTTTTNDNIKWDLDKMKLFVGGYATPKSQKKVSYFQGCLSDVMFQGVDIITTYFSQYPNNTNPVRGSVDVSPPYATAAQSCDDVISTVGTTSATSSNAKVTPTKKPGAAASYKASVFILVVAFLLTLLSF